jgi:chloramphenicol-sensitive protein RarD
LVLLVPRGKFRRLLTPRLLVLLVGAAAVISVNWGVYIWAVNHGHVVDASLGYYINPILSILIGVLLLHERLTPLQWTAVALAGVAVAVLTLDHGQPPWIALVLAASFATYGFLKKTINGGAVATLTIESALLAPAAIAYLAWLETRNQLTFAHLGWGHSLLLVTAGIVTLIPLLFFAAAATRVPLSTLGLLQYLTPTLQLLLGIVVFDEPMSPGRWMGFGLVWLALAVITADVFHRAGRQRRVPAAPEVVDDPLPHGERSR